MKTLETAFLITLLGFALTSTASAGTVAEGNIEFTDFVFSYTSATTLSAATTITLELRPVGTSASATGVVTAASGSPFFCTQDDCTSFENSPTATFLDSTVPFGISFVVWGDGAGGGSSRYSFTPDKATRSSTGPDNLTIEAAGTFADQRRVYDNSTASLILTFTESGGVVSGSGTIWIPAVPTPPIDVTLVPEPDTLVLLGGALVGIGLILRKKTIL